VSAGAGSAALDTSAAVPCLMLSHPAPLVTRGQSAGRTARLTTHSLAETYSVLTRLPGDARVKPTDAAVLLAANFEDSIAPSVEVSPAAQAAGVVLITRDARAITTYTDSSRRHH
jgi:hypothetical protein